MKMLEEITAVHSPAEIDVSDLDSPIWNTAADITATQYWSGKDAPAGRHFSAKVFWTETALYVRFAAEQTEPIVASAEPRTDRKTPGLWDRDVCEIFIAPDVIEPRRYFEFEAAPTGEWVDLAIDLTGGERLTDMNFHSNMETVSRIEPGRVTTAMKIPLASFGKVPKAGDVWLCNLFRCVGKEPGRGYVSWRPTRTETPNFHVPEAFGRMKFEREKI